MDVQARASAIRQETDAALAESGVEVEDVVIHPAGRRKLVRVTVVRDLGGLAGGDDSGPVEPLSLDEIAAATRTVGEVLDSSEVMGQAPYTLEVSSPGVDHPLTHPAQFRRNVGRLLSVQLTGGACTEGRLLAAGADGIRLDGASQDVLPYAQVTRAKAQVEFARPGSGEDR